MTGLHFTAVASDYKEDMTLEMPPRELAKFLSHGKAVAVAKRYKDAIVIGGDTFVALGKNLMGKAHTTAQAKKMLRKLSGKRHELITGFTVIDTKTGKTVSRACVTKVYFKKLSEKRIATYIKSGEAIGKAGGYMMQTLGSGLAKKIEGSYLNAIGLPAEDLAQVLEKDFKVKVPHY